MVAIAERCQNLIKFQPLVLFSLTPRAQQELTPNSADGVAFCDIELDAECAGEGCPEISGGQLHFEGAAMGAPVLEVSDQPQRKRLGIDAVLKLGAFKLPACHAIALVGIPAGRICADREACGSAEGRSPGMA